MENLTKDSLSSYVKKMIQSGATKVQIKEQLLAVGWSESQIDAVYSKALIELGTPVPSDTMQSTFGKKSSTVEIALNLFSFILLGVVATALGTLFYQIINKYFPDALSASYYSNKISTNAIHYSIAALIIAFPIYFISMRLWFRSFARDEGKTETKLTKWLTYLVLLVVSITIIGDLIATVFTFLQGELSARFFLKALTIFVISGIIFSFYFLERKKIQYRNPISGNIFKYFGLIVSSIVIIGIILGFFAGGSPATERKRTFDNQRERNLSTLSNCVENYAEDFKKLPVSLSELGSSSYSSCSNLKDPETKQPYSYRVVIASTSDGIVRTGEFEICAVFSLPSDDSLTDDYKSYGYYSESNNNWSEHSAGLECYTRKVVLEKLQINNTFVPPIQNSIPARATTPVPARTPTPIQ